MQITYADFCQLQATTTLGSKAPQFFKAGVFGKFALDEAGAISAQSFFHYVVRKGKMTYITDILLQYYCYTTAMCLGVFCDAFCTSGHIRSIICFVVHSITWHFSKHQFCTKSANLLCTISHASCASRSCVFVLLFTGDLFRPFCSDDCGFPVFHPVFCALYGAHILRFCMYASVLSLYILSVSDVWPVSCVRESTHPSLFASSMVVFCLLECLASIPILFACEEHPNPIIAYVTPLSRNKRSRCIALRA